MGHSLFKCHLVNEGFPDPYITNPIFLKSRTFFCVLVLPTLTQTSAPRRNSAVPIHHPFPGLSTWKQFQRTSAWTAPGPGTLYRLSVSLSCSGVPLTDRRLVQQLSHADSDTESSFWQQEWMYPAPVSQNLTSHLDKLCY